MTIPEPLAIALGIAFAVIDIAIRVVALIFVPRNRRPQTALAWLLLIFFQPYLGGLLFLLFGRARLPRNRRRRQREVNEYILETTEGFDRVKRDPPWPPWLEPIVDLNRALGSMPLVGRCSPASDRRTSRRGWASTTRRTCTGTSGGCSG